MFSKTQFVVCIFVLYNINYSCSITLEEGEKPELTEYTNERNENGYFFKYNLNDGQQREERGEIVKKGDKEILVISGFYSFVGQDGQEYYTGYESDENGYRSELRVMEPSVGLPASALASLAGGGLG